MNSVAPASRCCLNQANHWQFPVELCDEAFWEQGDCVHYASGETPAAGDRIQNDSGGLGTVITIVCAPRHNMDAWQIRVKWDQGIVEIDYQLAAKFRLVSRARGAD